MSRRRPGPAEGPSCAEIALEQLCVQFGYCIPPEAANEILSSQPETANAFVEAVVIAEGRDPVLMPRKELRPLVDLVADWVYEEDGGKGSASDRPRFPSPPG